ncbi:haloacid dehalogenase-like hydrolase [Pedobacter sp. HMF7647]|uniref:Haloacid dehalogenase-like hydrolase n=1 Tax=Hufsiella arboris TaxID=2695275 RepID=A0A7K1YAP7_9SPHI|nr:HAD family hydrolase [Hufsiella arboris]MXV51138.1 haloacid dehalogenase-like hydrolase [Hufsiella arboris]
MVRVKLLAVCLVIWLAAGCKSSPDKQTGSASQDSTATTKTSTSGDPLPSWNDGAVKKSITDYVTDVTKEGSADFIPVRDRIATFDNDGTLWSEQPIYFELFYALDEVKAMAPKHPDWKTKQPFKAVLENNMGEMMKQGQKGLLQIFAITHSGMTTDQFDSTVSRWADTAKHPIKKKRYKDLVFQPMLELVKYLQANQFKVFIVSGGEIDFMRAWAEDVYGIPKNQIVGSSIKSKYEYNNGKPFIIKTPELDFIDDKEGKPVGIMKYIGRRPVFAAGNSDGDLQMLQWAASNKFKNFEIYVHHTDSVREWAYDRKSHIGTLDKGLDEAIAKKWAIADMKNDWKVIYPSGK